MSIWVILLAGGQGTRLKSPTPKVFLPLAGRPVASHSFSLFSSHPEIEGIAVVTPPSYASLFEGALIASPGAERQDSIANAFPLIPPSTSWVLIHDAARPFLTRHDLDLLLAEGKATGAAALAHPVTPTIKEALPDGTVVKTLDRSKLWEIYTPQLLSYSLLQKGLEKLRAEKLSVTDDISLAELLGHPSKLVRGSPSNWKITYPEDLFKAELQCAIS